MIEKEKLTERIEKTDLERVQSEKDIWEKHIFLDDNKVLIVGYEEEEKYSKQDPEEETINTFYWYWELRNSQTWEVLFENHENDYSFCESQLEDSGDNDQVEDIVGDIDESDICTWSDHDWIEDISETIALEVLKWLESNKNQK